MPGASCTQIEFSSIRFRSAGSGVGVQCLGAGAIRTTLLVIRGCGLGCDVTGSDPGRDLACA
eukprot:1129685-Rhodomonas_salina.1